MRQQPIPCPICAANTLQPFFTVRQVPVLANVLWADRRAALNAARGDLRLAFCGSCGHLYNYAFDPARLDYNAAYENSLHFSPRFQVYAQTLAADLVERYHLYGKKIVEIGSGKGDFLCLLCQAGGNQGVGFDPSYDGSGSPYAGIRFVPEYFSERHAAEAADFIVARHTLEHIPQPARFVAVLRRALYARPATPVFIEVPNARHTLNTLAIWDLIYEHVSYFTPPSLTCLFTLGGFTVRRVAETYEGQFLTLEATLAPQDGSAGPALCPLDVDELTHSVERFAARFAEKTALWRARLAAFRAEKHRVVLWGAGSKGISFLNFLQVREEIPYVVDINPRKHGRFISGSGQEIVPPEFLRYYRPDLVILMNPIYQAEVEQTLAELGVMAEVMPA